MAESAKRQMHIMMGAVNSLLLGCGDWGSIYYTCWLHSVSPHEFDRKRTALDVTTCDRSAAVQARNLLLLLGIIENGEEQLQHLWNIAFCVFLPSAQSHTMLTSLLLRMQEATASMAAFKQCPLGAHVSIEATSLPLLHEAYRMWVGMLASPHMSADRIKANRDAFLKQQLRVPSLDQVKVVSLLVQNRFLNSLLLFECLCVVLLLDDSAFSFLDFFFPSGEVGCVLLVVYCPYVFVVRHRDRPASVRSS